MTSFYDITLSQGNSDAIKVICQIDLKHTASGAKMPMTPNVNNDNEAILLHSKYMRRCTIRVRCMCEYTVSQETCHLLSVSTV